MHSGDCAIWLRECHGVGRDLFAGDDTTGHS